jgi:PHD/YefM family antitoxin component YafN of YafNO toxin-antitoxin module
MPKQIEILDLPPDARALVAECELTGRQTLFTRNGKPVVTLVSHDEYLALRETVDIANDEALRAQIAQGDEEAAQGKLMLVEDLIENQKPETRNQKPETRNE